MSELFDLIVRMDAIDALYGVTTPYGCTAEEVLRKLPSAQQWIPCSERMPEHSERYLVSVLDGIDRRTTVAPYHPQSRSWSLTGRMVYWKVIAWMPLPEPYKEET